MKLLDLAQKCGATIQDVAHTIEVQFNDSLPISASTHVPDRYVSSIYIMYEALKSSSQRAAQPQTQSKNATEELILQSVPQPETKAIVKPNPQPAKIFGDGDGKGIRLNVIAKDLNIAVQTVSEAFEHVFHGNVNPNSRVTPNLAERIYSFFGKKFIDATKKDKNTDSGRIPDSTETIPPEMTGETLLKFLKDAVNKKCLMATVLGYNKEKELYFVDVLGFKSLLYENEVKGDALLYEGDEIAIVPTRVDGKNQPEYVLVSMKRVDSVRRHEQRAILEKQRKAQREAEFNSLGINSKISGTVYEVAENHIIVEFGLLRGIIFKNNLFWNHICRIDHYFSHGTPIEAKVVSKEKESNRYNIQLSHKDCIPNVWEQIELDTTESRSEQIELDATESRPNEVQDAQVVQVQDGGLVISMGNGLEGFLPVSEMSYGNYKYYLDHDGEATLIDVFVKDFNAKKKRIIFTRLPYYDGDWKAVENEFHIDEIYNGKILRANDDGLLVELRENIEAFVPKRQLFWDRTKQEMNQFSIGSEVYILIKNIDRNQRKIIGSVREVRVRVDPWETNVSLFKKGDIIKVCSIERKKDGIMIESIDNGLIGKIPFSEISWIYSPQELPASEIPENGLTFDAKIIQWNPEKRMLRLSIRQLKENPWSNIAIGSKVSGTVNVKTHTDGGYLINLDCGLDAITYEKKDEMEIGSKVDFKVVKYNKSKQVIVVSHTKLLHDEKTDSLVRAFFI